MSDIATYFKGLPSRWADDLKNPRNVKALIQLFQRPLHFDEVNAQGAFSPTSTKRKVPTVWNGMVFDKNCLLDSTWAGGNGFPGDEVCPEIPPSLSQLPLNPPPPASNCGAVVRKRDGEFQLDSCNGGVTYSPGQASPTCAVLGTCGALCTGFYCLENPIGHPVGY